MTEPAVRVRGLTKNFGDVAAVRGIDLDVARGEMFGFLGPNGAGKTTTLEILCTLSKPTSGVAEVAGHDVAADRAAVRRGIGLVFQEQTLDSYLTAEQNLAFHGELYGMPKALLRERIRVVLEMVDLADRRRDAVKTFSGGMKRRLEIGRGLMHVPTVLFLDEPTIGLDPQTRAAIWDYIARLRETEDITVFVTTHYMDEADNCDRIAIIDDGRIVVTDTPEALKSGVGADRVQLRTADDAEAITRLRDGFGIDAAIREHQVSFAVADGAQFVPRLVTDLGVAIDSVTVTRPSLDDVFMTHTGRTLRDAETGGASKTLTMTGARR